MYIYSVYSAQYCNAHIIMYDINVRCINVYLFRFLFWFVTGKLCTDVVSIYRINKSYPVLVSV